MLIRDKDRKTLHDIFDCVDIPIEVWAYGSRVNNTGHAGSDLDLVVRSSDLSQLPYDTWLNITERIRESNVPILVELHDWARLPESFQINIARQHEVFYSIMQRLVSR